MRAIDTPNCFLLNSTCLLREQPAVLPFPLPLLLLRRTCVLSQLSEWRTTITRLEWIACLLASGAYYFTFPLRFARAAHGDVVHMAFLSVEQNKLVNELLHNVCS